MDDAAKNTTAHISRVNALSSATSEDGSVFAGALAANDGCTSDALAVTVPFR